MSAPVLWICGDVHLAGHDGPGPGDRFAPFLDHLAGRPVPGRLVILGDLFEFWLDGARAAARHRPVLERLRHLRQAGWRLDLVCGNREFVAGRQFEVFSGCRLHWPALELDLGPRRLRIVHGDRLCHDPGYHLLAAWMRGFWTTWPAIAVPELLQEGIAKALRRRSRGGKRSNRAFLDPRRVAACGRAVDTLLAGHIHRQERRRVRGVDLVLCGDWPPGRGHWVEGYADGALALRSSAGA